jgi:two-component system, chemotaxis family, chemotaxis protein CheY
VNIGEEGAGLMQQSAPRILIVEDDEHILRMLTVVLEDAGFEAATARNGQEALDQLLAAAERPRAILLDLNMPVMTGWEFRLAQKRHPAIATIPVVVISADRSLAQQPFTIDADGYFQKPINMPGLITLLQSYI